MKTGHQLPSTGQIVVQGDPVDGWTLVSWNGTPVPQDPGLGTELFVDFRDLITGPQMAAYHIQEGLLHALGTHSLTPFVIALQEGFNDVVTATVDFPGEVMRDIVDGLGGSGISDLASLLPLADWFLFNLPNSADFLCGGGVFIDGVSNVYFGAGDSPGSVSTLGLPRDASRTSKPL